MSWAKSRPCPGGGRWGEWRRYLVEAVISPADGGRLAVSFEVKPKPAGRQVQVHTKIVTRGLLERCLRGEEQVEATVDRGFLGVTALLRPGVSLPEAYRLALRYSYLVRLSPAVVEALKRGEDVITPPGGDGGSLGGGRVSLRFCPRCHTVLIPRAVDGRRVLECRECGYREPAEKGYARRRDKIEGKRLTTITVSRYGSGGAAGAARRREELEQAREEYYEHVLEHLGEYGE